jgi:prolyl-tRNA synthetase
VPGAISPRGPPRSWTQSSRISSIGAQQFRDEHTREINSKEEFYDFLHAEEHRQAEIHGGFALAHWNGSREVEEQIKQDLKVTIRCIPFVADRNPARASFTGQPSAQRVVWAKSY